MKRIISIIFIIISLNLSLNAFNGGVYKCFDGKNGIVFILNKFRNYGGEVTYQEHHKYYEGVWSDKNSKAELRIQMRKRLKEFLISKTAKNEIFMIQTIRKNRLSRFCKAIKVEN